MEARLLSFTEKRLARLFRQAALKHIQRDLEAVRECLSEASFLIEWSGRDDWGPALEFVQEWWSSVNAEREGKSPGTAPAAWIHLSQELASLLDARGDWVGYLQRRWCIETGQLAWTRRLFYGILSSLAFGLSALILILLARHALAGSWEGLAVGAMRTTREHALTFILLLGRVAGTVLMLEQGYTWGKKALTGQGEEPRVLFLGAPEGLAVVSTPSN